MAITIGRLRIGSLASNLGGSWNITPDTPTVTINSNTSLTVDWVITGLDKTVTAVELWHSIDGTTYTRLVKLGAVATYDHTGLENNSIHYYKVRYWSGMYVSGFSGVVSEQTLKLGNNIYIISDISKDTYIKQNNPTNNYGNMALLGVGQTTSAGIYRTLLKYDDIPSFITPIKLHLWICNIFNNASNIALLQIFGIKREWAEGTGSGSETGDGATWNKYDQTNDWEVAGALGENDYDNTVLGEIEVPQNYGTNANGWLPIPISLLTEFTQFNNNNGILLKNAVEDNTYHSYSSKLGSYPSYLAINGIINGTYSSLVSKSSSNPLIEDKSAFGSIVYISENNYAFFYPKLSNTIYRVNTTDGITWGEPQAVLTSTRGLEVCTAWKEGDNWYMLYRSDEWNTPERSIGLATSTDGINWTKYASNPVIDASDVAWAANDRIDPWGIIKVGETYLLWVNDVNDVPRQTGLFTSTDLISWTPNANNPIFDNGRYCVTPFKYGDNYYMIVPYTPEGNVSGANPWAYRLELYRCANPIFLPEDREFLGNIMYGGEDGEWDDDYLDTPSVLTTNIERDMFPTEELWIYYTGHNGEAPQLGWAHGLATMPFSNLEDLEAIAEPAAGE